MVLFAWNAWAKDTGAITPTKPPKASARVEYGDSLKSACRLAVTTIGNTVRNIHPIEGVKKGLRAISLWVFTARSDVPMAGAKRLFFDTEETPLVKIEHYLKLVYSSKTVGKNRPESLTHDEYKTLLHMVRSGKYGLFDPDVAPLKYEKNANSVTVHDAFVKLLEYRAADLMATATDTDVRVISQKVVKPYWWTKNTAIGLSLALAASIFIQLSGRGFTAATYTLDSWISRSSFLAKNALLGQGSGEVPSAYGITPDLQAGDRQYVDMNATYLVQVQEATDRLTKLLMVVQQTRVELAKAKVENNPAAIKLQLRLMLEQESLYGEVIRGIYGKSIKQLIDQTLLEYDPTGEIRADITAEGKPTTTAPTSVPSTQASGS